MKKNCFYAKGGTWNHTKNIIYYSTFFHFQLTMQSKKWFWEVWKNVNDFFQLLYKHVSTDVCYYIVSYLLFIHIPKKEEKKSSVYVLFRNKKFMLKLMLVLFFASKYNDTTPGHLFIEEHNYKRTKWNQKLVLFEEFSCTLYDELFFISNYCVFI